jgi:Tfp pilus assembly protein PilN
MRRYNYTRSFAARALDMLPASLLVPTLRGPSLVLAATLAGLALATAFEVRRLAVLDATLAGLHDQSLAGEHAAQGIHALEIEVGALRQRATLLSAARREAAVQVNDFARLCNRLPPQTWLTRIRIEPGGSWSIEGRSAQLAEIGATLTGLQRLDHHAPVHLISIARTGQRTTTLRFAIAWERRP